MLMLSTTAARADQAAELGGVLPPDAIRGLSAGRPGTLTRPLSSERVQNSESVVTR